MSTETETPATASESSPNVTTPTKSTKPPQRAAAVAKSPQAAKSPKSPAVKKGARRVKQTKIKGGIMTPATPPVRTQKATKAQKPKTANKVPSHPTYTEMIKKAISELKDKKGSSRAAIVKHVIANHNLGTNFQQINLHIRQSLLKGTASGAFQLTKGVGAAGSFRLGDSAKKPASTGAPVKKKPAAAKSPAKNAPATPKKATKAPAKKKAAAPKSPAASKATKPSASGKAKSTEASPKAEEAAAPEKAAEPKTTKASSKAAPAKRGAPKKAIAAKKSRAKGKATPKKAAAKK